MITEEYKNQLIITFKIVGFTIIASCILFLTIDLQKQNTKIEQQQVVIDSLNNEIDNYILLYNLADTP